MNSPLPSGTVTFLFTDIEGSTKLAQPIRIPCRLFWRGIMKFCINPSEPKTDTYFKSWAMLSAAAFHSANEAVNAAVDVQNLCLIEPWFPVPIKVRMGIHTGTAHFNDPSAPSAYSGYTTLASTQRIMSAGNGGQILLPARRVNLCETGFQKTLN